MEVVEEPGPPYSCEQKRHDVYMADSGTEIDCSSEREGCAEELVFTCTENNAKVANIFANSAEKATDVIQSNEAGVDICESVEMVEHVECNNTNIRNTGLTFEGAVENTLDNCNTGFNLGDMSAGDFDEVSKNEDNQESNAVEVKHTTFDSSVEDTLSNSRASVCNMIPDESDKIRGETSMKMDDSMNEIPKVDENSDKHFCDMSDLAYVTSIVLETPAENTESKKVAKYVSPQRTRAAGDSSLLERASKYLGRRLVAVEYDSSGTEDSSASTTELSSSSTESSSSSSSSSDSSDEEELSNIRQMINYDKAEGLHHQPPKTKDEVLPQELPDEEEALCNDLPEDAKLEPAGELQSFVELMLVIKAFKDTPALDADTIFFRKDRKPFGKVYDVFGPVQSPFYVVRFSSKDRFKNIGLKIGDTAYFAPDYLHVTKYVFVDQLRKMKGSDASWQHDQEPPPEFLDYSDDEEEAKAKAVAKKKRQNEKKYFMDEAENDADGEDDAVLQVKIHKGMKNRSNVREHQADINSSERSNFNRGPSYNNTNLGGTGFNAPFPNQPVRLQQRPSHPHSMTDQSTNAPCFSPHNGGARFTNSNLHACNLMSYHKPMIRPARPLNTRTHADQGFVNGSIIGSVKEEGMNCATTSLRDTSLHNQGMVPPSPERAVDLEPRESVNNSNENHSQRGVFSVQNDSHLPQQNQGPSYRPGYTYPPPPPPPPMWPRFDPTVPPPMLPSRVALRAPPGIPRRFRPPKIGNPPFSHSYRQNLPHVDARNPNWRT